MPSLKDLRTRITSVKSTQRITSAMKMVAAAKLRRAQEQAIAARPYAERMERMLGSLAGGAGGEGDHAGRVGFDEDVGCRKGKGQETVTLFYEGHANIRKSGHRPNSFLSIPYGLIKVLPNCSGRLLGIAAMLSGRFRIDLFEDVRGGPAELGDGR